jgi:hypothetical protein
LFSAFQFEPPHVGSYGNFSFSRSRVHSLAQFRRGAAECFGEFGDVLDAGIAYYEEAHGEEGLPKKDWAEGGPVLKLAGLNIHATKPAQ